MQIVASSRTAFAMAALFVVALAPQCASQAIQGPDDDAAEQWAAQKHEEVLSHVFDSPDRADGLDLDTAWVVTARMSAADDTSSEAQFSITKASDGEVTAVMSRLRRPLRTQLLSLYQHNQSIAPAGIAKRIEVDRVTVAGKQCVALAGIVSKFERLRTAVAMENMLVLDPRQYELWVDAGSQQLYMNLLGASSGDTKHPVIQWMEDARRMLEHSCARSGK